MTDSPDKAHDPPDGPKCPTAVRAVLDGIDAEMKQLCVTRLSRVGDPTAQADFVAAVGKLRAQLAGLVESVEHRVDALSRLLYRETANIHELAKAAVGLDADEFNAAIDEAVRQGADARAADGVRKFVAAVAQGVGLGELLESDTIESATALLNRQGTDEA